MEEIIIDDDRTHVLTKYASTQGMRKTVRSDHNILFCKFSITFDCMKSCVRREFFNLKDQECQKAFLEETSNSTALSSSFSTDRSFPHNANVFFKNLKGCIQKCFKKVRIRNGGKLGCESVLNIMEGKMKMRSELKIKLKN